MSISLNNTNEKLLLSSVGIQIKSLTNVESEAISKKIHNLKNRINIESPINDFSKDHQENPNNERLTQLSKRSVELFKWMTKKEKNPKSATWEKVTAKVIALADEFFKINKEIKEKDDNLEVIQESLNQAKEEALGNKSPLMFDPRKQVTTSFNLIKSSFTKDSPYLIEHPQFTPKRFELLYDKNQLLPDLMFHNTNNVSHHLTDIVTNLVTNASKYGLSQVKLELEWISNQDNIGQYRVSISNDGQGILDLNDVKYQGLNEKALAQEAKNKIINFGTQSENANASTGSGIGGASIFEMIKELKGTLDIKTRGAGYPKDQNPNLSYDIATRISVSIPLTLVTSNKEEDSLIDKEIEEAAKAVEAENENLQPNEEQLLVDSYSSDSLTSQKLEQLKKSELSVIFVDDNLIARKVTNSFFQRILKGIPCTILGDPVSTEDKIHLSTLIANQIKKYELSSSVVIFMDNSLIDNKNSGIDGKEVTKIIRKWLNHKQIENVKIISSSSSPTEVRKSDAHLYEGALSTEGKTNSIMHCLASFID